MIKLTKVEEPDILKENGATWLKILQDKVDAGETPTETESSRYRHPHIKAALKLETHGKCAYCESKLLHVAFGDVEHIVPKSRELCKTFEWTNLTLACDVCNTNKARASCLVDPYADEPEAYFTFLGPMIYAHPELSKGIGTVRQLRLNRPELLENRLRRIDAIANIMMTIKRTEDEELRSILIDDLCENEAADRSEYAAFVRSFVNTVLPKINTSS